MLSGDNGVLKQAGNAKTLTDQAQEKENIQLAYLHATSKDKYDVTTKTLNQELQNNSINGTATKAGKSIKVSLENGNTYLIDENGNIDEYKQSEITPVYVVIYNDGEMVFNSTGEKDTTRTILYDGSNNDIGQIMFSQPTEIPWKDYQSRVTKVTIADVIAPLYTGLWFYGLTNFTTINNIEKLDTSNTVSMRNMFRAATAIEHLDLSSFDTGNVTDMFYMFAHCTNLKNVDVTNFETSKVTTMNSMFMNCPVLEKLDVSGFNTSEVTNMNSMFFNCLALEELDVSGFNTSKVEDMLQMFSCCINLEYIDVSSFDTHNVTIMRGMFMSTGGVGDMKLKKIKGLEGFDTKNVENMQSMFQRCTYLEELDLRNFNTEKVSNMSYMFSNCFSIKTIYVSNNFTTDLVTTSDYMFSRCSLLVGNNGTRHDETNIDVSMAKIDTAVYDSNNNLVSGTPGYFSTK